MTTGAELPIPPHHDPDAVGSVWRVDYEARARDARAWAAEHGIEAAARDGFRVGLLLVDVQNTFCVPGFELFVGGRSGTGAVDDNRRLCGFLYRNLGRITTVVPTLDTHSALQIFHALALLDPDGRSPDPYTLITPEDVARGRWRLNPAAAQGLGLAATDLDVYLRHYTASLEQVGRYALTVWPYHAMIGGIGHAVVSAVEEAVFFHAVARIARTRFQVKGQEPLTESYSALGPEVRDDGRGRAVGRVNGELLDTLLGFDALIVAGQARSHCVAWTVADLLAHIRATDPSLAHRVYLLDDCSSPVVVPGVIDYTDDAEAAYATFAEAGMHRVRSTDPMARWPGPVAAAVSGDPSQPLPVSGDSP